MTTGGWIIMCLSVGSVSSLFGWCLYQVFSHESPGKKLHGIEDIDTRDAETEE